MKNLEEVMSHRTIINQNNKKWEKIRELRDSMNNEKEEIDKKYLPLIIKLRDEIQTIDNCSHDIVLAFTEEERNSGASIFCHYCLSCGKIDYVEGITRLYPRNWIRIIGKYPKDDINRIIDYANIFIDGLSKDMSVEDSIKLIEQEVQKFADEIGEKRGR